MEVGTAVYYRFGVFCHTAVQLLCSRVVDEPDSVEVAGAQAPAAAHAVFRVYVHLFRGFIEFQTLVRAFPHTALAAATDLRVDGRLSIGVLCLLAGTGSTAQADVFDGTTETGHLMTLKMCQADEYVRIHDGAADFRFFDVSAALHRNCDIVGSLKTVSDDHRTSYCHGRKSVFPGAVHMLDGVLTAAGIQVIEVGQEGNSARLL